MSETASYGRGFRKEYLRLKNKQVSREGHGTPDQNVAVRNVELRIRRRDRQELGAVDGIPKPTQN